MCLENTNRLFRQANLVNKFTNVCTIFYYPGRSEFAVLANAVHTPSLGVFNMGSRFGEHIVSCYYYFFFQSYCTQTVSHFVQEMVHTKNIRYITNYTVHIVSATLYLVWHTAAPRPPVKYNAFNNNYSAESRQGQLYALLARTRSRSVIT